MTAARDLLALGFEPVARTYTDWLAGPRRQELTTPAALFADLEARYRFTLDGAASPHNALLPRFSSETAPLPWIGERVFCNPPWSSIPPFVELAATAALAVLLVPARTNAKWFHRALALGAQPRFFLGKPRFGDTKWNSPVDCLLLEFGEVA
jgi:hypothetical protein